MEDVVETKMMDCSDQEKVTKEMVNAEEAMTLSILAIIMLEKNLAVRKTKLTNRN